MRTEQKIIRNKAGLLELGKHLGSVSRLSLMDLHRGDRV